MLDILMYNLCTGETENKQCADEIVDYIYTTGNADYDTIKEICYKYNRNGTSVFGSIRRYIDRTNGYVDKDNLYTVIKKALEKEF